MLVVIGLFLYMGGLLHLYGAREHVEAVGDGLFPAIALEHMSPVISVIFIIALISALFPSADGAMTALTSSFCIDILNIKNKGWEEKKQEKVRKECTLLLLYLSLSWYLSLNGSMTVP